MLTVVCVFSHDEGFISDALVKDSHGDSTFFVNLLLVQLVRFSRRQSTQSLRSDFHCRDSLLPRSFALYQARL